MKYGRIALAGAVVALVAIAVIAANTRDDGTARETGTPVPVLSVAVTRAAVTTLPVRVPATGNIAAWQEASIGAEGDGLRLTEVNVNVGDTVGRGQVLARFSADIADAELAEARASVAQAAAAAVEADTNAQRAQGLERTGAMSAQQITQYVVAAATARARIDALRAVEKKHHVRLAQTRVLAPSDGIVTSRTATVGAVVPTGQELFRLIKDGRLEWRAAVAVADIGKLAPGQVATINLQGHEPIQGTLRMIAPAINTQTHDGLVYVDVPHDGAIRAGAFARGYFDVGGGSALTVPQSAVLLRDGFHYVMHVGPQSTVVMKKVAIGTRVGDRIEITEGLDASEAIVVSGVGFLSEGDFVSVVDEPTSNDSNEALATPHPSRSNAGALAGGER